MDYQETSKEAYQKILTTELLSPAQMRVANAINQLGSCTDAEIADFLSYGDLNKVRPRRNELVEKGLVVSIGKKVCSITGMTAYSWARGSNLHLRMRNEKPLSHTQFEKIMSLINKCNSFQRKALISKLRNAGDHNE